MIFLYFVISFFASIIGAVSGIGGGVIIKPIMDLISPLGVSTISFLSGTTVLSMACVSIVTAKRSGLAADGKKSIPMGFGSIIGGLAGKYIFDLAKQWFAHDGVVGALQSGILAALTLVVMLFIIFRRKIKTLQLGGTVFCFLTGIFLGVISSFLGIGGGPINIAVFSYFFSMKPKESAINSITVIFFSQIASLTLTLISDTLPIFDPLVLICMVAGGVFGGLIGSQMARKLSNNNISNILIVVMAIIIAIGLYNLANFINMLV